MTSKIFLITEILEKILLVTEMRTLLLSQRVCRKWRDLIQGSHYLRAALFLEPVRYKLPRGVQGIRNPLLEECIWPWFHANQGRRRGWQLTIRGVEIVPPTGPNFDKYFLGNKDASWRRMLFQQPPRSSIGLIKVDEPFRLHTPVYTEVKVQNTPRLEDLLVHKGIFNIPLYWTLPEEGIFWYGLKTPPRITGHESFDERYVQMSRELDWAPLFSARSTYLRDCDVVFFTEENRYFQEGSFTRRGYGPFRTSTQSLNDWLVHDLGGRNPESTLSLMPN